MEKFLKFQITHLYLVDFNAHSVYDMVHVFSADELIIDAKAVSVSERHLGKVIRTP